jgi:glycosyltransferase involved in cell wall biosynthesis
VTDVHVVLPDGVDDLARPSGGNRYDRRVCDGLTAAGWRVHEVVVRGRWPHPDSAALRALADSLAEISDEALVLVDGLVASAAAAALARESRRLRLVVLVHMPFGDVEIPAAEEAQALSGARAVVAVSAWTRDLLLDRYRLDPGRVSVVRPGADPADVAPGTHAGGRFLCVAALAPHKGQDVLVEALAGLDQPGWHGTLLGSPDVDRPFADRLRARVETAGLGERVSFRGPCPPDAMPGEFARADLVVVPSRLESYGLVVTEALAAGLPVVASAVGGIPEALGTASSGVPGILVPPGDPGALRTALENWLADAAERARLRRAAHERRDTLTGWTATAEGVAEVLARVKHEPEPAAPRVPR